ncbi:MAG TPA: TIGR02281 family clan AA aspartic protease [Gammaproteobacteria bacterium]
MPTEPDRSEQTHSKRIGVWMVAAAWIVLLWLLTMFIGKWSEREYNPNQNVANMLTDEGAREVVLQRNRSGHYVTSGFINNKPVTFMLDTGATDISIPGRLADELGLERGATIYFQTANGPAAGYATMVDSVAIGHIQLNKVRASINPNVKDLDILLGMTFLKHLEFTQRGNTLTLRQHPVSR